MQKDSVKKVLNLLSVLLLVGCASKLTHDDVNLIIEKQFKVDYKNELTQFKEVYDNNPELKKEILENEKHRFNNALILRNKVIDSLKMMSYDKSMIIENTKDLNGLIVTVQYFFFNNKIFSAGYDTKIVTKNKKGVVTNEIPVISETTFEDLKANYQNDILEIYNHFNKNDFSKIEGSFDCTPSFGSYKVTLIIGNKIGYYGVQMQEKCNVITFHHN